METTAAWWWKRNPDLSPLVFPFPPAGFEDLDPDVVRQDENGGLVRGWSLAAIFNEQSIREHLGRTPRGQMPELVFRTPSGGTVTIKIQDLASRGSLGEIAGWVRKAFNLAEEYKASITVTSIGPLTPFLLHIYRARTVPEGFVLGPADLEALNPTVFMALGQTLGHGLQVTLSPDDKRVSRLWSMPDYYGLRLGQTSDEPGPDGWRVIKRTWPEQPRSIRWNFSGILGAPD
jgi:hypothetical protein